MPHFLEYERTILEEINEKSTVVVCARGISTDNVVGELLNMYADDFSLCLVLNCDRTEINHFKNTVLSKKKFYDITRTQIHRRKKEYKGGGVFFGTARCFLTDFVNKNIQVDKISTIFIMNAHKVREHSSIAFILHIFREYNALHLVKAFVTSPLQLTQSISDLCYTLQCQTVKFLPRFKECFNEFKEFNFEHIGLNQSTQLHRIADLITDMIDILLQIEFKSLPRDLIPNYKDAVICLKYRDNSDIRNFICLLNLLYNVDPLTLYIFYGKMLYAQNDLGEKGSWGFSEVAHEIFEEITNYAENEFIDLKDVKFNTEVDEGTYTCSSTNEGESDREHIQIEDYLSVVETQFDKNNKLETLRRLVQENREKRILILVQNKIVEKVVRTVVRDAVIETHGMLKYLEFNYDVVVMLNLNLCSFRLLEYKFTTGNEFELFVLCYNNSVEEEFYFEETEREREQFEKMMAERITVPIKQEIEYFDMEDNNENGFVIVVDVRETRSKLPFYLHKTRNKIEIKTLPIGDYEMNVGDDQIIIERKSVTDFKNSINSNRLYHQGHRMCNAYKYPFLLLEFDSGMPTFYGYENDNVYGRTM
ncbi:RAD1 [Enterospora canceri]|uniref:RAD1 n=1 Tax=Enterospora canceri TaxID=1081671 RepID=A0A1Y1S9I7_9MICR|nr:RAD1 [Enterospora canceri]